MPKKSLESQSLPEETRDESASNHEPRISQPLTQAKENTKPLQQIPSTLQGAALILPIYHVRQQHTLKVRGEFSVALFQTFRVSAEL